MSAAPTLAVESDEERERRERDELAKLLEVSERKKLEWAAERAARPAEPLDEENDDEPRTPIPSNHEALESILSPFGGAAWEAKMAEWKRRAAEHEAACKAVFCQQCGRYPCADCRVVRVAESYDRCRPCALAVAIVGSQIPKRYRDAHQNKATRIRSAAARELAARSIRKPKIVFVGAAGAGKTTAMCAAAHGNLDLELAAGRRFARALFVSAIDLGRARALHRLGDGEADLVTEAIETEFLLLDDLGAEGPRDSEGIIAVIHARHDANTPIWITTALSAEEIGIRYSGGVERRIFERAVIIDCEGAPDR